MHIPDGFISPKVYGPAYAVAGLLWAHGLTRLRRHLTHRVVPLLAVITALAFVLMSVALPLPGGTTVHATGVAILTILFGVWTSFLAVTLVLILLALGFGAGGITALPVNALAMGLAGSLAAAAAYHGVRRFHEPSAMVLAGWLSVVVPAIVVAIVLGAQPILAHAPDGTPRFFPFGLSITIPAIVLPHLLVGVGEGVLTLLVVRLVRARWGSPAADASAAAVPVTSVAADEKMRSGATTGEAKHR